MKHYQTAGFYTSQFQAASVAVDLHCGTSINVAAVYRPPKHNIDVNKYQNFLRSFRDKYIFSGNFNAKNQLWDLCINTAKGNALLRAIDNLKVSTVSGSSPTYWPTNPAKIPDCIDFFIVKGVSPNYVHLKNNNNLPSDRSPIILTLNSNVIRKGRSPYYRTNLPTRRYSEKLSTQKST